MKKQEPLTESYFYILLCLYDRPRHGYGIMQKVAAISDGNVKIGSGTMYGAVSNMLKKGWIIEIESDDPEDKRKRLYQLTQEGRTVLNEEISRLRLLVDYAGKVLGGDKVYGVWEYDFIMYQEQQFLQTTQQILQ